MKLMNFRKGLCGPGSTAGHWHPRLGTAECCARHPRPGRSLCVDKSSGKHNRKRAKLQGHVYRPRELLSTPKPTHESKDFGSKKIRSEGADYMH